MIAYAVDRQHNPVSTMCLAYVPEILLLHILNKPLKMLLLKQLRIYSVLAVYYLNIDTRLKKKKKNPNACRFYANDYLVSLYMYMYIFDKP